MPYARPRYNPEPRRSGPKPVADPLTPERSRLAARHYRRALRIAAREAYPRPRPGRSREEEVADLAWGGLYHAARTYDPAVRKAFPAYLAACIRAFRGRVAVSRASAPAGPLPVGIEGPATDGPGHEAAVDAADAAEALLDRLAAGMGRAPAEAFRPVAFEGLGPTEAAARRGRSRHYLSRLIVHARAILEPPPEPRPCSS